MGLAAAALVDAGPLYAYVDRDDEHHVACRSFFEAFPGSLIVPILVIAEVTHLVATRLGTDAESRFVADLATGAFEVETVAASDWPRILELVLGYRDLPLGTVDASVVAAAERLGVTNVATLDRRHFGVVRPAHGGAFEILP